MLFLFLFVESDGVSPTSRKQLTLLLLVSASLDASAGCEIDESAGSSPALDSLLVQVAHQAIINQALYFLELRLDWCMWSKYQTFHIDRTPTIFSQSSYLLDPIQRQITGKLSFKHEFRAVSLKPVIHAFLINLCLKLPRPPSIVHIMEKINSLNWLIIKVSRPFISQHTRSRRDKTTSVRRMMDDNRYHLGDILVPSSMHVGTKPFVTAHSTIQSTRAPTISLSTIWLFGFYNSFGEPESSLS